MEWGIHAASFFFGLMCGLGISIVAVITIARFGEASETKDKRLVCPSCGRSCRISEIYTDPEGKVICLPCVRKHGLKIVSERV